MVDITQTNDLSDYIILNIFIKCAYFKATDLENNIDLHTIS